MTGPGYGFTREKTLTTAVKITFLLKRRNVSHLPKEVSSKQKGKVRECEKRKKPQCNNALVAE